MDSFYLFRHQFSQLDDLNWLVFFAFFNHFTPSKAIILRRKGLLRRKDWFVSYVLYNLYRLFKAREYF